VKETNKDALVTLEAKNRKSIRKNMNSKRTIKAIALGLGIPIVALKLAVVAQGYDNTAWEADIDLKSQNTDYNEILEDYETLDDAVSDVIKKSENNLKVTVDSYGSYYELAKFYMQDDNAKTLSNLHEAVFLKTFLNSRPNKYLEFRSDDIEARMEECATIFADISENGVGGLTLPENDINFLDNKDWRLLGTPSDSYGGQYSSEELYFQNMTHESVHLYLKITDEAITSLISHEISGFEKFGVNGSLPHEYAWQPRAYSELKNYVGEKAFWETFKKAYYKTASGEYIDPASEEFANYSPMDFGSSFSVDSFAPLFTKNVPITFREFKEYFNATDKYEKLQRENDDFAKRMAIFKGTAPTAKRESIVHY
jgi:hypothetical protein